MHNVITSLHTKLELFLSKINLFPIDYDCALVSTRHGFGIIDLEFGTCDLGFGIWEWGFGIRDMGPGIQDLGLGIWDLDSSWPTDLFDQFGVAQLSKILNVIFVLWIMEMLK